MYDYVRQHRWAGLRVGLLITIALIVAFLAVMFAGNIEKIIVPKVSIFAVVDDVKGLREGAPVWFSGVEIGAVKSIDFTVHHKINVEMLILSDVLQYLREDARASILTLGLLGDKYMEITPGSETADDLNAGDTIRGSAPVEIQDVVEASQKSIAKIADFVGLLEEILLRIEQGEGTVAKFLRDPDVYNNLKEAAGELTGLVREVKTGRGLAGRLLHDESLSRDFSASIKDIKLFARSLEGEQGTLSRLIHDPSLYEKFQRASSSLERFAEMLVSSGGTVNRLIEDESLYKNMNAASEKLDHLLGRIEQGEGLMGSLVNDEELSQELKLTLREIKALVKDIQENPGQYFKFSLF